MPEVQCEYCQKWMKSIRGLGQHLRHSEFCSRLKDEIETGARRGVDSRPSRRDIPHASKKTEDVDSENLNYEMEDDESPTKIVHVMDMDLVQNTTLTSASGRERLGARAQMGSEVLSLDGDYPMDWLPYQRHFGDDGRPTFQPNADDTSEEADPNVAQEGTDVEEESKDEGEDSSESGSDNVSNEGEGMTEEERKELQLRRKQTVSAFNKYATYAKGNFMSLTEVEAKAVRIMYKLIKKKAPLDTYEEVMKWHLRESGQMLPHETLQDCRHFYITRQKLMRKLRIRYHMDHQYATPLTITLPFCRSEIQVWKKLAQDNVLSLLTDPRWNDEDWMYFDDDPFAKPPEDCPFVEDLNTGEAYLATYRKLITKPNQILVALPLYIDGAVTGQFDKLQVTALKMSIGLLNRKARDKEYAWRNLGFVTNYAKEDHRGRKMFVESGHIAAHELYVDATSDEEDEEVDEEDDKAADYHAILSVLLESVKELISDGMSVDINYKGKLYKDCELVFFIPFVKCDGDEADKLCCSFRSRGQNVQQLCRYCMCPTEETDNPRANYRFKTEPMMKKLYEQKEVEKLRKMSQSCVPNAFHGLRFGLHNDRGVHGACPFELLHAVLLGIFKYARDCLFEQLGETSATAKEVNALAQEIGRHLSRQSDRSKPRTKFAHGILKGKLMAKEYTGVMLIIAAMLQTETGKQMLSSARRKNLRQAGQLMDWVLLIETLIQWEAYLNLPQMEKNHLQRLKKKHQFLLFLLKKVGARHKGMGFKVMKFHAVLHLAQDIEMFGVPMVVDTGSNESHHKTTKIAAKLTQKDVKTFEKQTSERLDDFHVLDLAMAEMAGRPIWNYSDGYKTKTPAKSKKDITTTGGMMFRVTEDEETKAIGFEVITRMKNKDKVQQDSGLLHFVLQIQKKTSAWLDFIPVCAEHIRNGQIFRSHPNYRGKGVWRDWVMIEWNTGDYPAKIWGFLDVSELPEHVSIRVNDECKVSKGVWAVIESCNYTPKPAVKKGETAPRTSELFKPIILEALSYEADGYPKHRKFYVVDVDSFKKPLVVIPNIGTKCEFLMMTPRDQWSEDFKTWVAAAHREDMMEMED